MGSLEERRIGQIVIVVRDVEKTAAAYCRIFGIEMPPIQTVPPVSELPVYYHGALDQCAARICVFDFSGITFEITEPGEGKSVWKDYLDRYGEGVFDIGFWVDDRKKTLEKFKECGCLPVHVGFFKDGTYSILDTKTVLGTMVNIHCHTENFGNVVKNPPELLSQTGYTDANQTPLT